MHRFGRVVFAIAFLFLVRPTSAQSQACGAPIVLPGGSDYLYSSLLDRPNSRYFAFRQGETLTVAEVSRDSSLHVNGRFSLPVPAGVNVSVAFSDGYAVVSFSRTLSARAENQTPEELSWVRYYNLVTGSLDLARTFQAATLDLLPTHGEQAPFYSSSWAFSSWHVPMCQGSSNTRVQQGRILGGAGSKVVLAYNAEQFNACNETPYYYTHHLNMLGEPTTPILASEHCPSCQYWWYQLDPGVLMRNSAGSVVRLSFPTDINSPDGEDLIAPQNVRFGAINTVSVDPTDGGFAISLDTDTVGFPVRNVGGILFYDANGTYRGFGTTYGNNAHLGETGALAPLGTTAYGEILYAAGSGRNIPAGGGGFNVPSEFQTEFRPEGGHVGYFLTNGEQLQLDFGDHANDNFGAALAPLGDINVDLQPDIVVGAPGGNYASIISVIAQEGGNGRGTMYKLVGSAGTHFGKQLATLSTSQNGRADVIVVAADDSIKVYDVGTCLRNATPVLGLRDRLRRLIPQARAALAPLPPRRADRNAVNRGGLDMHPATQTLFFKFAAVTDVLHTSNEVLPSDEEQRAAELEASYFVLNSSLNARDKNMILLQRITPSWQQAQRYCPSRQRRNGRSRWCREYRRLAPIVADYNNRIAAARGDIDNMKAVQNRNYNEMENELR